MSGLGLRLVRGAGAALVCALWGAGSAAAQALPRPLPDTTDGVHVFNDRVFAWTQGQVEFAATHYAGTAKLTRAEADALRAVNPGLVVLHYRLGIGLGYRTSLSGCDQAGSWVQIIDGGWTQEWPGPGVIDPAWHATWNGLPLYMCGWSWWLMDVANAAWRDWWTAEVLSQLDANDADGLFADSFLVPNFLATDGWSPDLPGYDPAFEAEWYAKLDDWMDELTARLGARYVIPNPGMWVTTRDQTDYSKADGLFVEGFACEPWSYWGFDGWRAQLDRLLPLAAQGKALIAYTSQTWSAERRMFALASYLLMKGARCYLDLEHSEAAEWWPEYEIPIGAPLDPLAADAAGLFDPQLGVWARRYGNGLVLVNAGPQPRAVTLPAPLFRAAPSGGGVVPDSGVLPPDWRVDYVPTTALSLGPGCGAVLLVDPAPHRLAADPLVGGQQAELVATGGAPHAWTYFFATRTGEGATPYAPLGVTLGLTNPRPVGVAQADGQGRATRTLYLPAGAAGTTLWLQAAAQGSVTQVLERPVW